MKIIAVDDEAGALKLLEKAIRANEPDADVRTFQDPAEALRVSEAFFPNAAFLDIQMPEIGGLDLAKGLKAINPLINIIFTTGFSEYAVDAMQLRSSGYLLKPVTKQDVALELENLRHPITPQGENGMVVHTFGNFDVFLNGKPVHFAREKSKEMLALLVDKRGMTVTRKEIAAILFEDREYSRRAQSYLSQIVASLTRTLKQIGRENLLVSDRNSYSVDIHLFSCDSYDYLDGNASAINKFHGEYMAQYSWGEERIFQFYGGLSENSKGI